MLKLVFAGTPDVAVPSLKAFAADPRFDVVGVITRPDAPTGRGRKLTPSPVKATALELGLSVIDLKPRSPEFMEALNDAINASKKVSFQYFTYNVRKEQKLKYDGYTYVFSPYKLIWNGDYYYVVGFSEKHKGIGSFRVDRIARCPKILDEDAVQPPKNFDLNVYLNSMFRMYNGQRKQIELVCSNDVMDAIIDKFGKDVHVLANDMKSFRAVIETSVGSVFYSWIFGFGGRVAIKSPEDVKAEYAEMVRTAAEALSE